MPKRTVIIDCFPECVTKYRDYGVVAIDVIRATTTVVTAVSLGRRCFPVDSVKAAKLTAAQLSDPLLVGELGGIVPPGFHMNNSPMEIALRTDIDRPIVLLSTSGTKLIRAAGQCQAVYIACLRNYVFLAQQISGRHPKIAVVGAGSRNEFREEDQFCCALVAKELIKSGYEAEDQRTLDVIRRWDSAPVTACARGKSAAYLRSSGQSYDLDFILSHVNDVNAVATLHRDEVIISHSHFQLAKAQPWLSA